MKYRVQWYTEWAHGLLPDEYDTSEAAQEAGRDWRRDMIAMDEDPQTAELGYEFEVRQYDHYVKDVDARGNPLKE